MFPSNMQDPEYPSYRGDRLDGQNLVAEWIKNKKVNNRDYKRAHQIECKLHVICSLAEC